MVPEWSINVDNETIRSHDTEPVEVTAENYHIIRASEGTQADELTKMLDKAN